MGVCLPCYLCKPYHGMVVSVERHGQEVVEVIFQVFLK